MRYLNNSKPMNKALIEKMLSSGNVEEICNALVSIAFYESDWKWAQEKFLDLLDDDNPKISGISATCLGHIARIHRKLDKERVISILRNKIGISAISGRVQDALDDIEIFV